MNLKYINVFKKLYLETQIFLEPSLEDNLYIDPQLDDLDRHHWHGRLARRHANEDKDRQIWSGMTFCDDLNSLEIATSNRYFFTHLLQKKYCEIKQHWPWCFALFWPLAAAAESFHNRIEKSQSRLTRYFSDFI